VASFLKHSEFFLPDNEVLVAELVKTFLGQTQ